MKARLPQGYGGGPQNMTGMLRQAQKMQEEITALQEQLDAREYEVKAGGGVVTVVIAGTKEIKSISLAPEIVDPDDIETLTDTLVAGINEAIKKVETVNKTEMEKITGNISMPGLF
nr:YbaB/EbfC family nucleoid-associated protein [Clostridia bacterium]